MKLDALIAVVFVLAKLVGSLEMHPFLYPKRRGCCSPSGRHLSLPNVLPMTARQAQGIYPSLAYLWGPVILPLFEVALCMFSCSKKQVWLFDMILRCVRYFVGKRC